MHTIAHWGCMNTVRESALKVDWEENPLLHQGIGPASVFCLAVQSSTLHIELFCPAIIIIMLFQNKSETRMSDSILKQDPNA